MTDSCGNRKARKYWILLSCPDKKVYKFRSPFYPIIFLLKCMFDVDNLFCKVDFELEPCRTRRTPFPWFSIFILFFCCFVLFFFFCHFRTAHYKNVNQDLFTSFCPRSCSTNLSQRVRFFKKTYDWSLKSEKIRKWILRFCIKQINPRSFGFTSDRGLRTDWGHFVTLITRNLNLISVQTWTYLSYLYDRDSIGFKHEVFWCDILFFTSVSYALFFRDIFLSTIEIGQSSRYQRRWSLHSN